MEPEYEVKRRHINGYSVSSKHRNVSRRQDQEGYTSFQTHGHNTFSEKSHNSRTIFLTHIPSSLSTTEKIEAFFESFGHIERIKIEYSEEGNNSATVTFQQEEEALMASNSVDAIMGEPTIQLRSYSNGGKKKETIDVLIQNQKDIISKLENSTFVISNEERKILFQSLRSIQDTLQPLLSMPPTSLKPTCRLGGTSTPTNRLFSKPNNIDNRPRTLLIQMVSPTDVNIIKNIFSKYGQIEEITSDENSKAIFFVKYSKRFEAENVIISHLL